MSNFLQGLVLLGQGMASIFIVMAIIFGSILLLHLLTNKKNK